MLRIRFFLCLSLIIALQQTVMAQIIYPGTEPGKAEARLSTGNIYLENNILKLSFVFDRGQLHPFRFTDKENKSAVSFNGQKWFELQSADGSSISDSRFHLTGKPVINEIAAGPATGSLSGKPGGKVIRATFINDSLGLAIDWEASLSNGANYVRQHWAFHATKTTALTKYTMAEIPGTTIIREGTVDGSPLILNQMFFALEHPMSHNDIQKDASAISLQMQNALTPTDSLVITTVSGVTPLHQLRRGFLYYLERERSHPYRPFLHYNSWYDLSWVDRKMSEDSCLDRIRLFGDSLIEKRHVPMQAFLFDDGWDNDSTLWEVSKSFPEGFSNMHHLANQYRAKLGLWVSPWGGYDPSQAERLKYGRQQHPPFETNKNGFSLAGPVYFNRFKAVTTNFMLGDDVAIFKFDGVGAGNGASGAGVKYQRDIDALLLLTKKLKAINPDLYLSLTVGTWPSPYWLYYGDAIWRAGGDFGLSGKGAKRQQWITYRDGESYKNVVKRAPLFPLNSVMLHGIDIAHLGYPAPLEMDMKNISDGIWSFFGSGTSLQELYINPHLLTAPMWDQLAAAAKWSKANADILVDVHWVGGDPEKEEIYGYGAWAPRKGILTLRNPSTQPRTFVINLQQIFELPAGVNTDFRLTNAIDPQDTRSSIKVQYGTPVTVQLAPFELKVWDATPLKKIK